MVEDLFKDLPPIEIPATTAAPSAPSAAQAKAIPNENFFHDLPDPATAEAPPATEPSTGKIVASGAVTGGLAQTLGLPADVAAGAANAVVANARQTASMFAHPLDTLEGLIPGIGEEAAKRNFARQKEIFETPLIEHMPGGSEWINKKLGESGFPTTETVQPTTPGGKLLQQAVRGATAFAAPGIAGKAAAVFGLPKTAEGLSALAPGSVAGSATIGAGAGAAGEAAQEAFPKSEIARPVGEVAGALGGGLMGAVAGEGRSLAPAITQAGRNQAAEEAATRTFTGAASAPIDQALKTLEAQAGHEEIIPGSRPTTAELANDPGLLALQRARSRLAPTESPLGNQLREQNAANNVARVQALEEMAPTSASPVAAQDYLARELRDIDLTHEQTIEAQRENAARATPAPTMTPEEQGQAAIGAVEAERAPRTQALTEAEQAAQQRTTEATGNIGAPEAANTPQETAFARYGEQMRDPVQEAYLAERERLSRLREAIDPTGTMGMRPDAIKKARQQLTQDFHPDTFGGMENKFYDRIDNWGDLIPIDDAFRLRADINARLKNITDHNPQEAARLLRVKGGIDQAINDAVSSTERLEEAGIVNPDMPPLGERMAALEASAGEAPPLRDYMAEYEANQARVAREAAGQPAEPQPVPTEPAAAPATQPEPAPTSNIANDVSQKLVAAGRPAEEANALGQLVHNYYTTRAARFDGAKGTAEELYAAEAPDIVPGTAAATGRRFMQSAVPGETGLYNPLEVPVDVAQKMARKIARSPDAGAPVNKSAVVLPNGVAIGPVSTSQWIKRVETNLTPDQILDAANWYRDALPSYEQYFGKERAPEMLGAWLIANQNVTPEFAQLSAVRAAEQYLNRTTGSPVAGLANQKLYRYWDGILSGDPAKLTDISTGQKIYDFIDSAIGKKTRTFYGDDPRAGAPAVADVHSLRDTGRIDPTLRSWVEKTFGEKVASRIQPDRDFQGLPEAQYEWAGDRMRQWTSDLNRMGWMGKRDWTPSEVQAVGWMSMSKMLGRQGQTAEQAIKGNVRNLSYELDFGEGTPWSKALPDWQELPVEDKARISQNILDKAVNFATRVSGAHEFSRIAATGGWGEYVNPAFRSRLIASPEVTGDVANMIGYLAQQTAVYESRWMRNGNTLGLAIHGEGLDSDEAVRALWGRIVADHPDLAAGFSPTRDAKGVPGIEMTFDGAGRKLEDRVRTELLPTVDAAAKDLGLNTEAQFFKADAKLHSNDWTSFPDGREYLQRLGARYGPEIQQKLDNFSRVELEPSLRSQIDEATGKPAAERAYAQGPVKQGGTRGTINFPEGQARAIISLMGTSDASTFIHESGHQWLEDLLADAKDQRAPAALVADERIVRNWLNAEPDAALTDAQHEKFARGLERYLMEGKAPSSGLANIFAQFKQWLTGIYQTVTRLRAPITEDIRGVFDRMLGQEPNVTGAGSAAERSVGREVSAPENAANVPVREAEVPAGTREAGIEGERPGGAPGTQEVPPEPELTALTPDARDRFAEWNRDYAEMARAYRGETAGKLHAVGKMLQKGGAYDSFRLADTEVPWLFVNGGKTSAEAMERFLAVAPPEAQAALDDAFSFSLRKAAMRPDGSLDLRAYQKWYEPRAAALAQRPELAERFNTAAAAQKQLDEVRSDLAEHEASYPLNPGWGQAGILRQFWKPGAQGGETMRRYLEMTGQRPEAISAAEDYAALDFANRPGVMKNGAVNPSAAEAWIKQHQGALSALPGLQERFANAAAAQRAVDEAIDRHLDAREQFTKSAAGAFLQDDPERAVSRLFQGTNRAQKAQTLMDIVSGDRAATEGVQRAVIDHIVNRFSGAPMAGAELETLKPQMFQNFIGDNRDVLERIFPGGQAQNFDAIAEDLRRSQLAAGAKMPGGSDTRELFAHAPPLHERGFSGALTALIGEHLGSQALGWFGGPVGAVAGLAARSVFGRNAAALRENTSRVLDQMIFDPEFAKDMLRLHAGAGAQTAIRDRLAQRLIQGAIDAARANDIQPSKPGHFAHGGSVTPDPEPTEAQKEVVVHGMPVTIENAKGSMRRGVDRDGKPWAVRMPTQYGYLKRTEGMDGEHVDAYLGPDLASKKVFVIDQIDADTKKPDEHKVMLGFPNRGVALANYLKAFSDGRGRQRIGDVTEMNVDDFKSWLKHGDTTEPLAA